MTRPSSKKLFCAWYSTARCNSRCATCNTHKLSRDNELSTEEALYLISQAAACGIRFFNIFGGEPLLRDDIEQLTRSSLSKGLKTILSTNGIIMDRHSSWIARERKLILTVSLDAMDAATYKRARGVDAFDKATANIEEMAAKLPPYSVRVFTTISPLNIGQVQAIVDFCEERKIVWLGTVASAGPKGSLFDVEDPEASPRNPEFKKAVSPLLKSLAAQCARSRHIHLFSGVYELLDEIVHGRIVPCSAMDSNLAVMNDGGVSNCFLLPPHGNLRATSLANLIDAGMEAERLREVEACYKRGGCTMSCVVTPQAVKMRPVRFCVEALLSGRIIELLRRF